MSVTGNGLSNLIIIDFIQKLEMFSKCSVHKYGSKYVQVKKMLDNMCLTDTVIFYLSMLLLNIFYTKQ